MKIKYRYAHTVTGTKTKMFFYSDFVSVDRRYKLNKGIILYLEISQPKIIKTVLEEIKRPGRK